MSTTEILIYAYFAVNILASGYNLSEDLHWSEDKSERVTAYVMAIFRIPFFLLIAVVQVLLNVGKEMVSWLQIRVFYGLLLGKYREITAQQVEMVKIYSARKGNPLSRIAARMILKQCKKTKPNCE